MLSQNLEVVLGSVVTHWKRYMLFIYVLLIFAGGCLNCCICQGETEITRGWEKNSLSFFVEKFLHVMLMHCHDKDCQWSYDVFCISLCSLSDIDICHWLHKIYSLYFWLANCLVIFLLACLWSCTRVVLYVKPGSPVDTFKVPFVPLSPFSLILHYGFVIATT